MLSNSPLISHPYYCCSRPGYCKKVLCGDSSMKQKSPIIIIEDDLDDQQILKETFTELGTNRELIFFDDCDKAFAFLMSATIKPFLIISDINMPGTDGISFKTKIDETDHLRMKSIPFIFLSTSGAENFIDVAYRKTNLQGYFQKGSSVADVKKQLECILMYWEEALQPK